MLKPKMCRGRAPGAFPLRFGVFPSLNGVFLSWVFSLPGMVFFFPWWCFSFPEGCFSFLGRFSFPAGVFFCSLPFLCRVLVCVCIGCPGMSYSIAISIVLASVVLVLGDALGVLAFVVLFLNLFAPSCVFSSRGSWKECGCERRLGAFAFVVLFLDGV